MIQKLKNWLAARGIGKPTPKPREMNAARFFEILREKGPTLDRVGQSYVIHQNNHSKNSQPSMNQPPTHQPNLEDELDEEISPARRFRQTRTEITSEFNDLNTPDPDQ